jgi:hypothetical protein
MNRASICRLAVLLACGSCANASTSQQLSLPSYAEVVQRLHALQQRAPQLVELWNAQDRYAIASPGECGDQACKHWFVSITNRTGASGSPNAPAPLSDAPPLPQRPQIFLSGNLHGDETVGPMTLLLLLEDLVAARLRGDNPWFNQLVDTRLIVAIPITNPKGFVDGRRDENGLDPNRDFPYDISDPALCMRSTTARAVNEVWRAHLFTLAITFHGGMQSISYEWGAPNHAAADSRSPDDVSQRSVGLIMREAAGAFLGSKYPVDRTNKLVYPVEGGMEDWAYAASWEPDPAAVRPCEPQTYGGYPREKTVYNRAVLRALNMLVETADAKHPADSALGFHGQSLDPEVWNVDPTAWQQPGDSLGSMAAVLAVQGPGDGHVPRNLRLVLSAIDMLQPYVTMTRWRLSAGDAAAASQSQARERRAADADASSPHRLRGLQPDASATPWPLTPPVTADFSGPRECTEPLDAVGQPAPGGPCRRFAGQYESWVDLQVPAAGSPPTAAADGSTATASSSSSSVPAAGATLQVGWDVGGGMAVDETATLLGTWDLRVPPSFLTETPVGDLLTSVDISPAAVPQAVVALLQEQYGVPAAEAASFARYVRVWQLFLAGRLPPAQLPLDVMLRRSAPQAGTTRWVFADLAPQQVPVALPPAELREAAVAGVWDASVGAARLPTTNALSPIVGSPDMIRHPFVTRFTDCVRVSAPPLRSASGPSSADANARTGLAPCTPTGAPRKTDEAGEGRALQDAAAPPSPAPSSGSAQGYFLVPYAVVDKDWGSAGVGQATTPAGQPPQGHLANARTNPGWVMENGGFIVQGRSHAVRRPQFFAVASQPVVVPPRPSSSPAAVQPSPSAAATVASTPAATRPATPAEAAASNSSAAACDVVDASKRPQGAEGAAATPPTVSIAGYDVSTGALVAYSGLVTGVLLFVLSAGALHLVRARRASRRGSAVQAARGPRTEEGDRRPAEPDEENEVGDHPEDGSERRHLRAADAVAAAVAANAASIFDSDEDSDIELGGRGGRAQLPAANTGSRRPVAAAADNVASRSGAGGNGRTGAAAANAARSGAGQRRQRGSEVKRAIQAMEGSTADSGDE